jgi:hypothetical protein
VAGGLFYIGNSIVAGNTDNGMGSPDVNLTFYSLRHNFIGITNGSIWYGNNDAFDYRGSITSPLNPLLGPLTATAPGGLHVMSPRPASPVIDKGDSLGVMRDARGLGRPVDQTNIVNAADGADIGAVEAQLASQLVYEWTFDNANLSTVLGPGTMTYADAATPGLTAFETTDGSSVPHIAGEPASYMRVPAFTALANGYHLTLNGSGPNAGGLYMNRFTIIMDVFIPAPLNWFPLFNTSPLNENDADLYVAPTGAIGIGSGYSAVGVVRADTWHRIAVVVDSATPFIRVYVDGVQVLGSSPNTFDGRWSLFSNIDSGPDLLLFNEGDLSGIYTHEVNVASVAFTDRVLSAAEIAVLGASAADGIFVRRLRIARNGSSLQLTWRSAPNLRLERTANLRLISWQPITGTLSSNSYTTSPSGISGFYRLETPP